jgi:hypothetical protein
MYAVPMQMFNMNVHGNGVLASGAQITAATKRPPNAPPGLLWMRKETTARAEPATPSGTATCHRRSPARTTNSFNVVVCYQYRYCTVIINVLHEN